MLLLSGEECDAIYLYLNFNVCTVRDSWRAEILSRTAIVSYLRVAAILRLQVPAIGRSFIWAFHTNLNLPSYLI